MHKKSHEEVSPHVHWIVAAMIALTLVILAYQRSHHAEFIELKFKANVGEPPDVPEAEGKIKVGPEKSGVRRTEPVLLQQGKK
jgi:hypothetical protein